MKKLRFLVVILIGILIIHLFHARTRKAGKQKKCLCQVVSLTYYDMRDGINHDRGGRYNIYGRGDKYNFMYDKIDEYKVRVNEAKIEIIHFNNHDDLRTRLI